MYKKKYDYVLNGLVYYGECGNEAIFAHRKSKNWEGIRGNEKCWKWNSKEYWILQIVVWGYDNL